MDNNINVYTCPHGHKTVTIDTDEGTTPMTIRCRQKHNDGKHNCTEWANSAWYNCDQSLSPEFEWYKPDIKKVAKLHKEHVMLGGLLLRKLKTKEEVK